MDTQKQQIVDSVKQANNILVTVSNNPSVDQLAACIGLTLALNKMKKHATAVFSGSVPSIIEFLQPEKTLEKTTDSLRDFIIAIDKAKADKLRYKVEDKFVKIFITPYRTSINERDLQFSEGDFNVDVVLALGVHKQTDLDQAITAHGRILHDATVISINNQPNIELGSINLLEPQASSLSEMTVGLLDLLDKSMVDDQIATALLTGIVAETDRFRNAKTTPATMSISAELLTAGANQQLVASKLASSPPPPIAQMEASSAPTIPTLQTVPADKPDDGTLEINHDESGTSQQVAVSDNSSSEPPKPAQINIDDKGQFQSLEENKYPDTAPAPALPSLPPMGSTPGSLPPLGSQPLSPSPLNPFAGPPLQRVEPPVVQSSPEAVKEQEELPTLPPKNDLPPTVHNEGSHLMMQPPTFDSQLNAGITPQDDDEDMQGPSAAAISLPQVESPTPLLQREPPLSSMPPLSPLGAAPAPALPSLPPMGSTPGSLPPLGSQPLSPSPLNPFARPPLGPSDTGNGSSLPPLQNGTGQSASLLPPSMPPLSPLGAAPAPALPALPSMGPTPSVSLPPPPPPIAEPSPAAPTIGGTQTGQLPTNLDSDVKSPQIDYIEAPVPTLPSPLPSPGTPATEPVVSNSTTYTDENQADDVKHARSAIEAAFGGSDGSTGNTPIEPVISLNAQPLGSPLHESDDPNAPPPGFSNDPNKGSSPPAPLVPPPLIPPSPS